MSGSRYVVGAIAGVAMSTLGVSAQAAYIKGEISMAGNAQTVNFVTDTVDILGDIALVLSATGDLASAGGLGLGSIITYNDFNYGAIPPSVSLWTGGFPTVFTFTLDKITSVTEVGNPSTGPASLDLFGRGTLSAAGFDDTPARWSFSWDRSTGQINAQFSSGTTVSAPEPATLGIFGLGLLGAAWMVRRRGGVARFDA
jgi:hypothetical protein